LWLPNKWVLRCSLKEERRTNVKKEKEREKKEGVKGR